MEPVRIMLDIETLGCSANAMIIAIGGVATGPMPRDQREQEAQSPWPKALCNEFDSPGLSREFYARVEISTACGKIDPETVFWWMQQSEECRNENFFKQTITERLALISLNEWLSLWNPDQVWAKPPRFDISILETSIKSHGLEWPIAHRKVMCYRTIAAWHGITDQGDLHHALEDARYQMDKLMSILSPSTKSQDLPGQQQLF